MQITEIRGYPSKTVGGTQGFSGYSHGRDQQDNLCHNIGDHEQQLKELRQTYIVAPVCQYGAMYQRREYDCKKDDTSNEIQSFDAQIMICRVVNIFWRSGMTTLQIIYGGECNG